MKKIIILIIAIYIPAFADSPALIMHMEDGTTRELNLEEFSFLLSGDNSNNCIEIWTKSKGVQRLKAHEKCMGFYLNSDNPKFQYLHDSYRNINFDFSDIDSIRILPYNEINSVGFNIADISISGLTRVYLGERSHKDQVNSSSSTFSETVTNDIKLTFRNGGVEYINPYYSCATCDLFVLEGCINLCSSYSGQVDNDNGMEFKCSYKEIRLYLDTINQKIDSIYFVYKQGGKYSANSGHGGSNTSQYLIFTINYPIPYNINNDNTITASTSINNLAEFFVFKESFASEWHLATSSDSEDKDLVKYSTSVFGKINIKIYK